MHHPGHRHPVLRLGVVHRVTAEDRDAGLVRLVLPALEDAGQRLHRKRLGGEGDEVQGEQRAGAHGPDVGERVGGGNLSVGERVVHHRREEVHRGDHRLAGVQTVHRGVVGGGEPH